MIKNLSIRTLLFSLVLCLTVLVVLLASFRAWDAWRVLEQVRKAEDAVFLGDRLLEANFNWARERGQTLSALVSPDTAARALAERIQQAREAG